MNRGFIICILGGVGAILIGSQIFLSGNSTPSEPNLTEELQDAPSQDKAPEAEESEKLDTVQVSIRMAHYVIDYGTPTESEIKALEPALNIQGWKGDVDAKNLLDIASELKAMIPKLRATVDEALSENVTPDLQKRLATLSDEYRKKVSELQDELQKYKQEVAKKRRKAIEEFAFLDVTFDVKRPAFLSILPADDREPFTLYPDKDRIYGLTSYDFLNLKSVSSALYKFIDDDLYEMRVSYDFNKLSDLGGFDGIYNRLLQKFGPPDLIHPDGLAEITWNFPEFGRRITLQMCTSNEVYITALHLPRLELVKRREAAYELSEQHKAESRDAGF